MIASLRTNFFNGMSLGPLCMTMQYSLLHASTVHLHMRCLGPMSWSGRSWGLGLYWNCWRHPRQNSEALEQFTTHLMFWWLQEDVLCEQYSGGVPQRTCHSLGFKFSGVLLRCYTSLPFHPLQLLACPLHSWWRLRTWLEIPDALEGTCSLCSDLVMWRDYRIWS